MDALAAQLIGSREVDDPWFTDGLYYGTTPEKRTSSARIKLEDRPVTRIGALAFIRAADKDNQGDPIPDQHGRRYPHHERAAEQFKSMYEALYGGVSPAVDPSKEPVDTSARAHDAGMAARIDRGDKLRIAMKHLERAATDTLIDMLIFCTPCSEYADVMPSGQRNQRQIAAMEARRLDVLDALADHWGLQRRARAY